MSILSFWEAVPPVIQARQQAYVWLSVLVDAAVSPCNDLILAYHQEADVRAALPGIETA